MAQNADTELAESDAGRCLNCGEALQGAFCACGQRSVPVDPTVSELAGVLDLIAAVPAFIVMLIWASLV